VQFLAEHTDDIPTLRMNLDTVALRTETALAILVIINSLNSDIHLPGVQRAG
jgi:hypothetical protein